MEKRKGRWGQLCVVGIFRQQRQKLDQYFGNYFVKIFQYLSQYTRNRHHPHWGSSLSISIMIRSSLSVKNVGTSQRFCAGESDFYSKNIARGTTDPEIDSVTWTNFGNNMARLALVAHLATRWRHLHYLQIWPPDGTTCIIRKFDHHMTSLGSVLNFT